MISKKVKKSIRQPATSVGFGLAGIAGCRGRLLLISPQINQSTDQLTPPFHLNPSYVVVEFFEAALLVTLMGQSSACHLQ